MTTLTIQRISQIQKSIKSWMEQLSTISNPKLKVLIDKELNSLKHLIKDFYSAQENSPGNTKEILEKIVFTTSELEQLFEEVRLNPRRIS